MAGPDVLDTQVPLPDGSSLDAFLAVPPGPGHHPAVVVLHEVFGVNDDIRRIATRFAEEGYAAAAPNLYSHGSKPFCLTRVLLDSFVAPTRGTLDDIEAVRRWLGERPGVDGSRVAVAGFCMGGGFALAYAPGRGLRAASVNYGRVPKGRAALAGVCPVVGSYGKLDRYLASDPARLEEHLTALGVPHDIKAYDGVGHSFMNQGTLPGWVARLPNPMHVGYSEEQAADSWRRILAFFAEHLG